MEIKIMAAVMVTGRGKKGDDKILMENKKCQQPNFFFFFLRDNFFFFLETAPTRRDRSDVLKTGKSSGGSSTTW